MIARMFVKVIHDCTNDSGALKYQHGIILRNIFDTQVLLKNQHGGSSNIIYPFHWKENLDPSKKMDLTAKILWYLDPNQDLIGWKRGSNGFGSLLMINLCIYLACLFVLSDKQTELTSPNTVLDVIRPPQFWILNHLEISEIKTEKSAKFYSISFFTL